MKIGISTIFSGYNFGSALQAYAVKKAVESSGYTPCLFRLSGSFIKGRDVRLKKLFVIGLRSLLHPKELKNLNRYKNTFSRPADEESVKSFEAFESDFLQPFEVSYRELKKLSATAEYKAFICGSDQIWNGDVLYADPFYYLRYAPYKKRIAFTPSFGRTRIADFNKRIISKYVSQIPYLSVREKSGADIVKELIGVDIPYFIDPTLLFNRTEWAEMLSIDAEVSEEPYILTYFLDTPSESANKAIKSLLNKYNYRVINISPIADEGGFLPSKASAGPKEFAKLIMNSAFVVTDSFHGTAFSLNFNVPCCVFERNCKTGNEQSSRIKSLFDILQITDRFEPNDALKCSEINFECVNSVLDKQRSAAKKFLIDSIEQIK